ncbi:MAG: acyl-CoA dehydrogenase family protein [Rubrobacter sp.]|jgi:alkylation response protein AidB-like acyl-CoA dehydrogenase|nr:acyl-CoA dehydrogenase family protein [Rubrobacter sp.]
MNPAGRMKERIAFEDALAAISAGAAERDAEPGFPREPFRMLAEAGMLSVPVPERIEARGRRSSFAEEWRILRAVSKADGSVGRILDGHFNAVERVSLLAPEPLRAGELEAVAEGKLLLGVWGADPIPGEGESARLADGGDSLEGVKTFCSGATGLDRALVAVRGEDGRGGPPHVAYVDLHGGGVEIDTEWFTGSGMRSSESHRVEFHGARVLAVLGERSELVREPYFSRDAVRTAVVWAGVSDLAVDSALDILAAKSGGSEPDDIVSLAAGAMVAARASTERWIEAAASLADTEPEKLSKNFSIHLRQSVAAACRLIVDEAERATGSHPFAAGGPLDRAARDVRLMLLQHRLEPQLARSGREAITERVR